MRTSRPASQRSIYTLRAATGLAVALVGCLLAQWAVAAPQGAAASGPRASARAYIEQASAAARESTSRLGYSLMPSSTEPYAACPPERGFLTCKAIIDPKPIKTASGYKLGGVGPSLEGGGEGGGWTAKELQAAYKIPTTGGSTQTVAIVDAYDDPKAVEDLAQYRVANSLPECNEENSKHELVYCFRKINQKGEEGNLPSRFYPRVGAHKVAEWGEEISLDLDMVSASCPECKILLVEANSDAPSDLYAAEEEAQKYEVGGKKVATEVSNSWGGEELSNESEDDKYFEHTGEHTRIPVVAAAGDEGYKVEYPAASKYVISVGGTTLKKKEGSERGWGEEVWKDTGSGCSEYEPKPSWQTDQGCSKRATNDVAAVANKESPVSVYDTYEYNVEENGEEWGTEGHKGWGIAGGTSAATPLVAGVEAHASSAVKAAGAEAFYDHTLFDVTERSNALGCRGYLCNGEEGYDAPTAWGTLDGALETSSKYSAVTSAAEELTPASARLAGYVFPEGKETTYHFEYGKTASYGTNVPVSNGSAGSGGVWKGVSQSISGLEWETTYHYRVVATRGSETAYGKDHTFVTVPWTVQATPVRLGVLKGVACTSASACIAVGERGALAESWNGTEWKVLSVPAPSGGSAVALSGVACSSASACAAVGQYTNSSKSVVTLAERWNGTEWAVQSTPNPSGALQAQLTGVSCPSASACVAVGSYETSSKTRMTLAEQWNGTEWSIKTTTGTTGGAESAKVSCSSASACTADRAYEASNLWVSLVERWNGSEWQVQKTPTPEYSGIAAKEVELRGVTCLSTSECYVVGRYFVETFGSLPLVERWNGTEWQVQTIPHNEITQTQSSNELNEISCSSSTVCTAIGQNQQEEDFAERWNGKEWKLVTVAEDKNTNSLDDNDILEGISCVQPEREVCMAVGEGDQQQFVENETVPIPFAESREGTSTGEATELLNGAVNPNGAETKYFFEYGTTTGYGSKTAEASAGSGTGRVEVSKALAGLAANTTFHYRLVATNSHGTSYGLDRTFKTPVWRVTSTPNPPNTLNSYLWGVSCSSSSACTAVGEYEATPGTNGKPSPLVERWNGSEWALQSTPSLGEPKAASLDSVACASASSCIAVGYNQSSTGTYHTLSESWSGSEWALKTAPEPSGAVFAILDGVSCSAASACTAVGYYETSAGGALPFALRWNGSEWALQSMSAPSGAKATYAGSVSCPAASACTAAGFYTNSSGVRVPFAEAWNGSSWSLQTVPNPSGSTKTEVESVSCTSSTACTLVGSYETSTAPKTPLAERWNGSEWKEQTAPGQSGAQYSSLWGVSCASATSCTAVGVAHTSAGKYLTLADHWNGSEWALQSTPNDEKGEGWLTGGVSCVKPSACTAVGNTGKTFAETYS